MPELPEVETVRRGLAPAMENAGFETVTTARPDLRFPLPARFCERLAGAHVEKLSRRGKYLTAHLSTAETLIMHLGMSGRFTVETKTEGERPGAFHYAGACDPAHDHVVFRMAGAAGRARIVYNDPRRFGFMDLVETASLDQCRHFAKMGPEPLSPALNAAVLSERLIGRNTPIKAALLDQAVVAGLGNIYVCEALFRAGVSPRRTARTVPGVRAARQCDAVNAVLTDAMEAGGSSLRDFASAQGALGYFQHRFAVYDRAGEACHVCGNEISRLVQSGRSTFYCGRCQR